jgi:PKD repeat protein
VRSWLIAALLVVGCAGPGKDPSTQDTDPNQLPVAHIDAPRDGSTITDPSSVELVGRGTDPEDGELHGAALVWRSDQDGLLGSGDDLTVELSEGEHQITLTVTDSRGGADDTTIELQVVGENEPPVATILGPADATVLREGDALVLHGAGDDREDGALSGAGLVWASSRDGVLGTGADVTVPSPSLGEHVITLTAVDSGGLQDATSISVTVAAVGANLPPVVTIAEPLDGSSVIAGASTVLRGTATDPEDGAITTGLVWSDTASGVLGTGNGTLNASFPQGPHTLTLTATDSNGLSGSATVTVSSNTPGNDPPVVTLVAPLTGATVDAGASLDLRASATDTEDGVLGGASLVWTSSLDGALGTGSPRAAALSALGRHTLTVVATDSGGASDSASVDVFVRAPNQAPTATITQPASGSRYTAGTTVRLVGNASDPEDGALNAGALSWTSSVQGALGTGSPLDTASLVAGTHTVTLTALDSGGRAGTDSITLLVDPAVVNLPPTAVISASPAASVGQPWDLDASASSDPDGTVVTWRVDWGDSSAVTTGADPTVSHTYAAAGTYTVTLTVTDNDGATDDATTTVSASIPPRVPEIAESLQDEAGWWCSIALDSAERPWVAFANARHRQVWLTHRSSTSPSGTWSTEMVEGPGFQVGGLHFGTGDLTVDSAGVARVVYNVASKVRYAERSAAGAWTLETVATPAYGDHVGLLLDPAASGRPTVAYTKDDAGTERLVFLARTAPGTWSALATTSSPNDTRFTGAWWLLPAGDGGAVALNGTNSNLTEFPFSGAAFTNSTAMVYHSATSLIRRHAVVSPDGRVHVGMPGAVWTLSGGTWQQSVFANAESTQGAAIGWDANEDSPVIAFLNDQAQIEIQRETFAGAWTWDYQGPMDDSAIDLAVEADGDARVCFFRDGNLVVY